MKFHRSPRTLTRIPKFWWIFTGHWLLCKTFSWFLLAQDVRKSKAPYLWRLSVHSLERNRRTELSLLHILFVIICTLTTELVLFRELQPRSNYSTLTVSEIADYLYTAFTVSQRLDSHIQHWLSEANVLLMLHSSYREQYYKCWC